MGSRPPKDGESPSASTIFLPQLRHSRRGSIASLSSVNQIDKETLSQALDQIHSTASQTETLTTFNEFTAPPSSSSALDSKGIASELQGGISGLYNRFRASVGNTKDALSAGVEDDTVESLSVRSIAKSSPSPSIKAGVTPTRAVNQSPAPAPDEAQTEGGRQPPVSSSTTKDSVVRLAKDGGQAISEAHPEPEVASGPAPSNFSQAIQVEDGGSTSIGGKSNTILTKRGNAPTAIVGTGDLTKSGFLSARDETSHSREPPAERPVVLRKVDSSSIKPSLVHQSSQSHRVVLKSTNSDKVSGGGGNDEYKSSKRTEPPSPLTPISRAQAYSRAISDGRTRADSLIEQSPLAVNEGFEARPSKPAVDPDQIKDKPVLLDQTSRDIAGDRKGRPQHLDLTSRKSMAPPLVSHAQSPKPPPSRASSTDTNTDSLNSAPHQTPVRQANERIKMPNRATPVAQAALQRDPRMMNSFSQSRNKVLNKEYWMKDENARDCFNCGEAFSTFRRKHHCRESISSNPSKLFAYGLTRNLRPDI